MKRLIEKTVFSGLVIAWRLATWPTSRSPDFDIATTDGVSRLPSALGMTVGSPPSSTDTTELVVPRSIPITLAIKLILLKKSPHQMRRSMMAIQSVSTERVAHTARPVAHALHTVYLVKH